VTGEVHVLATAEVGGRRLRFEAVFRQSRLRITLLRNASESASSEALGSVVYLDSDEPGLRIRSPLHVDGAVQHCAAIIGEAERIWGAALRECDG
jgi:hypothetical protein